MSFSEISFFPRKLKNNIYCIYYFLRNGQTKRKICLYSQSFNMFN